MKKDTIYIDVEDDITAIIGKVKDARESIVALVPPKRIGGLQSAVNLRLLARAASQADKRLVLITNNQALTSLAASAKIPVAKNLQSKPEIPEIAALEIDDGEDIIDGAKLPVGELVRTSDNSVTSAEDKAVEDIAAAEKAAPPAPGKAPARPKAKSGKVPDFNRFRKKLIFIILAIILLIGFFVWATFFAPRATVVIQARTNDASINQTVTIREGLEISPESRTLPASTRQVTREVSVEFEATGEREVGERASGTVTITNCESTSSFTIASGTNFTASSGEVYTNASTVTVPGFSGSASQCRNSGVGAGTATAGVTASAIGDSYNITARSYTIAGVTGDVSAGGSEMTGGSQRTVDVVSNSDVEEARRQLSARDTSAIEDELAEAFGEDFIVLDGSFSVDNGDVSSRPSVNEEARNGRGELRGTMVYELAAVNRSHLDEYLTAHFEDAIENPDRQRLYENGLDGVRVFDARSADEGWTATLIATAKIGPRIDDNEVRETVRGQRYGDIQAELESIQGVEEADTQFWPFWVRTVPNNDERIRVEFRLNESE